LVLRLFCFSYTFVLPHAYYYMRVNRKYIATFLFFSFFLSYSFAQKSIPTAADSLHPYYILTLKDGTVLKGKILAQERKYIQFQDEVIGNVTFYTKNVCSMEKVDPQDYYLITLMNGTVIQGKIVNKKENEISIETVHLGIINVDANKISTIKGITPGNVKDGKYWFKTHVDVHYFITPSAIPLRRGEVYFQNTMAIYNSFRTGITNNFSCAGGVILPLAAFIVPSVNFKLTRNMYAGGGIIAVDITGLPYAEAAYAGVTFGNRYAHVSVGGGYGVLKGIKKYYYSNKLTQVQVGLVSVSAFKRFSPKYALVTDNWFTPDEGIQAFTGGLRLMGEKSSWDLGIAKFSVNRHVAGNNLSLGPISFLSYLRNL
jgi:hypothetical protein